MTRHAFTIAATCFASLLLTTACATDATQTGVEQNAVTDPCDFCAPDDEACLEACAAQPAQPAQNPPRARCATQGNSMVWTVENCQHNACRNWYCASNATYYTPASGADCDNVPGNCRGFAVWKACECDAQARPQ